MPVKWLKVVMNLKLGFMLNSVKKGWKKYNEFNWQNCVWRIQVSHHVQYPSPFSRSFSMDWQHVVFLSKGIPTCPYKNTKACTPPPTPMYSVVSSHKHCGMPLSPHPPCKCPFYPHSATIPTHSICLFWQVTFSFKTKTWPYKLKCAKQNSEDDKFNLQIRSLVPDWWLVPNGLKRAQLSAPSCPCCSS